jgi:pimeloyl-ACP methyl ester carboxylesterase
VAKGTSLIVSRDGLALVGEHWPGPGPAAVFLHAGVTDSRCWGQVVPRLTHSLSPVTYDRRGFGQTPVSPTPFSHIDDLFAFLAAVTDKPAWLVGSSMGGGLALDAALMAPELVAGLVLIAPAVGGAPEFELDPDTSRIDRHVGPLHRPTGTPWCAGHDQTPVPKHGRAGSPFRSRSAAASWG